MNTTPIEKCYIGKDAKLTVKLAKEKGWSSFLIYPNGNLIGTSPEGIAGEPVPKFARILCDAAPDLLAVKLPTIRRHQRGRFTRRPAGQQSAEFRHWRFAASAGQGRFNNATATEPHSLAARFCRH